MYSARDISAFVEPTATSWATSASRGVRLAITSASRRSLASDGSRACT
jgi:hypothetical protein